MEICLYNDIAFKWAFGRQKRTKPLISLLNAVVGHKGQKKLFRNIRILNPFDISKYQEDKRGILDLRVKETGRGLWADVEIQVLHQESYPQRSMFYLAGLYRDQLSAGEAYSSLRPCYGIHFLMSDLLEDETDWYNCYRMKNEKSGNVLNPDWNLYYLEIPKFLKTMEKDGVLWNPLEQWCAYLSEPHDPSEPLAGKFGGNEGIKEVHEMLQEFTEDDRLREQYRLHEAWLMDQRTIELERRDIKRKLAAEQLKLAAEKQLRKKAEAEKKKAEAEKKKAEAEKKKAEAEKKKAERRSVLGLSEAGYADERIAEILGIPEDRVKAVREGL
jgi:predicted transposase/invertase (TIGR01784 family)